MFLSWLLIKKKKRPTEKELEMPDISWDSVKEKIIGCEEIAMLE